MFLTLLAGHGLTTPIDHLSISTPWVTCGNSKSSSDSFLWGLGGDSFSMDVIAAVVRSPSSIPISSAVIRTTFTKFGQLANLAIKFPKNGPKWIGHSLGPIGLWMVLMGGRNSQKWRTKE